MLVHGDLGPSLVKEGISVADMIGQLLVSLQLGVIGMVISILVVTLPGSWRPCTRTGGWTGG